MRETKLFKYCGMGADVVGNTNPEETVGAWLAINMPTDQERQDRCVEITKTEKGYELSYNPPKFRIFKDDGLVSKSSLAGQKPEGTFFVTGNPTATCPVAEMMEKLGDTTLKKEVYMVPIYDLPSNKTKYLRVVKGSYLDKLLQAQPTTPYEPPKRKWYTGILSWLKRLYKFVFVKKRYYKPPHG